MRGLDPLSPVATPSLPPISPLRGLLEVTRLVRAGGDLLELLAGDRADDLRVARLRRRRHQSLPAGVGRLHRHDRARQRSRAAAAARPGARPSTTGSSCSTSASRGAAPTSCTPAISTGRRSTTLELRAGSSRPGRGADAWDPEDALFVPMRHTDGHLLGILSVDEPASRRRPTDEELDVLVALADHAALAVQSAQEAAEAARHKVALEQLLEVSARLPAEPVADEILRAVCAGVRDALGFQNVLAVLRDAPRPARPARSGRLEDRRDRARRTRSSCVTSRACSIPSSRSRAASCCRARKRSGASRSTAAVRVGAERARPVGVGPPLAARAAARQSRRGDRCSLGGRA